MIRLDDYTFHVEPLTAVIEEIKPMLAANHEETGFYDRPFNPDFQRYCDLDEEGSLPFFTVRRAGQIVGFAAFFLDRQIYQTDVVAATQTLNYVDKGHRGIGYSFMKFCDDSLKNHGVNSVWRQATPKFDISKIYERMGYKLAQKSYRKDL